MQDAKDTFFIALRDRLAVLNPARTVELRNAIRTAVLVEENELAWAGTAPLDAFALRWTTSVVDSCEPMPLHTMGCEIRYATRGTAEFSGMDRGRALAAMDAELRSILQPRQAQKTSYASGAVSTLGTVVFWSEPEAGAETADGNEVARTLSLSVFALDEGETQ